MAEYIEREALLAHIKDLPTWWADEGGYYGGPQKLPDGLFDPNDIIASIENRPAVDIDRPTASQFKRMAAQMDYAPVVHGQWIPFECGAWAECSECGESYDVSDNGGMTAFKLFRDCYKHCPNCGAKMDEG